MEEPAPKRRKTESPDRNGLGPSSSALKQPPRRPSFAPRADRLMSSLRQPPRRPSRSPAQAAFAPDRDSSPLRQPPRRPSSFASFASPTKATLARNYPNLLPPQTSSPAPAQNGYAQILAAKARQARAFILGEKNRSVEQDTPTATPGAQKTTMQKAVDMETTGDEEADLPTTPNEKLDTPRRGILFSSPSKRPPKMKSLVKKTSPYHPKSSSIQQDESEIHVENKGAEKSTKLPDPELEQKRREKKQLIQELKELEQQVSTCTKEIEKLHEQPASQLLAPEEREDLITLINKINPAGQESDEEKEAFVSNLLCSFLPFSTRVIPPPRSIQPYQKPILSHRPIELDDPLPYLEMFTDFKISTQPMLPGGKVSTSSDSVHQKHIIDLTGPQKLLNASISIVIDVLSNTIIHLEVLRLSTWAERELGVFMRKRAREQDLGNVSWAIGSFWGIAKKRAEYWHKCETMFAHLLPGRTRNDRENAVQGVPGKSMARKDFHRYLGRDVLVLQDQHVMLRISWAIGFDWTGEAESSIKVRAAVPEVWTEADNDNSFKKIPETFDSLLQSKGAFAATKTMVALLFAE